MDIGAQPEPAMLSRIAGRKAGHMAGHSQNPKSRPETETRGRDPQLVTFEWVGRDPRPDAGFKAGCGCQATETGLQ